MDSRTDILVEIYYQLVAALERGGYGYLVVPIERVLDPGTEHCYDLDARLFRAGIARIAFKRGLRAEYITLRLRFSTKTDFYRQIKRFGNHADPPKREHLYAIWDALRKAVRECGGD